jgi:hypothetical protein
LDGLFSDIFPGYPGVPNGERGLAAAAVGDRWGHFVGDRLQYPQVNAVLVFIRDAICDTACDAIRDAICTTG